MVNIIFTSKLPIYPMLCLMPTAASFLKNYLLNFRERGFYFKQNFVLNPQVTVFIHMNIHGFVTKK